TTLMAADTDQFLSADRVPYPGSIVAEPAPDPGCAGGTAHAIRRANHSPDRHKVARIQRLWPGARELGPHRLVVGCTGEALAIGGEGNAVDTTLMAADTDQFLPADRVPHPGSIIVAAAGDPGAIGRKAHAIHRAHQSPDDNKLCRIQWFWRWTK